MSHTIKAMTVARVTHVFVSLPLIATSPARPLFPASCQSQPDDSSIEGDQTARDNQSCPQAQRKGGRQPGSWGQSCVQSLRIFVNPFAEYQCMHAYGCQEGHLDPERGAPIELKRFSPRKQQTARGHQHETSALPHPELLEDLGNRAPLHGPAQKTQVCH